MHVRVSMYDDVHVVLWLSVAHLETVLAVLMCMCTCVRFESTGSWGVAPHYSIPTIIPSHVPGAKINLKSQSKIFKYALQSLCIRHLNFNPLSLTWVRVTLARSKALCMTALATGESTSQAL